MNGEEASRLGFGIKIPGCLNTIVCGSCNSQIEHNFIYYIASINEVMCKDCADDYIKNMSHYTDIDSLKYEISHFNIVAQKLGMSEKAAFSADKKIVITT